MAIIVTYDENGGFWDPVAPPHGDRWGPGSRIPTVIASPHAKPKELTQLIILSLTIVALIVIGTVWNYKPIPDHLKLGNIGNPAVASNVLAHRAARL
jgi:phospholipase C